MKARKRYITFTAIILGLLLLILDRATAMEGAKEGLDTCIQTVIPSLFPFMFLASLLTSTFSVPHINHNSIICRLYKIPDGAEGILLAGLLGGYPIGAKSVSEATKHSDLSPDEAERMTVFCNATGPAFLFGITGSIFPAKWIPWCLWGIHLLSGIFVARFSANTPNHTSIQLTDSTTSVPQQLRQSIRSMSEICGWIVLMRAGISVLRQRCLQQVPKTIFVLISGILELSTGCLSLFQIDNIGLRFVLCSLFLNFGGFCVAMQTHSVCAEMNQYKYISGKLLQAIIGFIIAYTVQSLVFLPEEQIHLPIIYFAAILVICLYSFSAPYKAKNSCGIFRKIVV